MIWNSLREQSVTFLTELTIHMIEKTLKEDQSLHYFAAIAARTDTQKADALKDHDEKALHDQKKIILWTHEK